VHLAIKQHTRLLPLHPLAALPFGSLTQPLNVLPASHRTRSDIADTRPVPRCCRCLPGLLCHAAERVRGPTIFCGCAARAGHLFPRTTRANRHRIFSAPLLPTFVRAAGQQRWRCWPNAKRHRGAAAGWYTVAAGSLFAYHRHAPRLQTGGTGWRRCAQLVASQVRTPRSCAANMPSGCLRWLNDAPRAVALRRCERAKSRRACAAWRRTSFCVFVYQGCLSPFPIALLPPATLPRDCIVLTNAFFFLL